MSNQQLTHDFLQFLIENYGVRLNMTEEDANLFERLYPDLVEKMEKINETVNNRAERP